MGKEEPKLGCVKAESRLDDWNYQLSDGCPAGTHPQVNRWEDVDMRRSGGPYGRNQPETNEAD